MLKSKDFEVRAIASRTLPTARKWAKKLGIPVAYGKLPGAVLEDPAHRGGLQPLAQPPARAPHAGRGAVAGKHVLCEKPVELSAPTRPRQLREVGRAG